MTGFACLSFVAVSALAGFVGYKLGHWEGLRAGRVESLKRTLDHMVGAVKADTAKDAARVCGERQRRRTEFRIIRGGVRARGPFSQ